MRAPRLLLAALAALALVSATRATSAQHPHDPPKPAHGATAAPTAAAAPSGSASAGPAMPSAEEVIARLKEGNASFVAGKTQHPHQGLDRVRALAEGQHPMATLLSCSDSRVPDELVFDQGFGDLFIVRVAGNVADTDELGTVEYGVDHLGTPLLVVLGHTRCGAVTAVATGAELHGHLPELVDNIQPAVAAERAKSPNADPKALVEPAIVRNVLQSMADILVKSPLVRARVKSGRAHVVGALYRVEDGTVEWLGEHPDQVALMAKGDAAPPEPHGAHGAAKPAGSAGHDPAAADSAHAPSDGSHGDGPAPAAPPPNLPVAFAMVAAIASLAGGVAARLIGR